MISLPNTGTWKEYLSRGYLLNTENKIHSRYGLKDTITLSMIQTQQEWGFWSGDVIDRFWGWSSCSTSRVRINTHISQDEAGPADFSKNLSTKKGQHYGQSDGPQGHWRCKASMGLSARMQTDLKDSGTVRALGPTLQILLKKRRGKCKGQWSSLYS